MKENEMLVYLIAFVLGYLVARTMRGNGFECWWNNAGCYM